MIRMKAGIFGIVVFIGAMPFSAASSRAVADQHSVKTITKQGHRRIVPKHANRAKLQPSPYRKQVDDFVRGKRSGLDGYDAVGQSGVQ